MAEPTLVVTNIFERCEMFAKSLFKDFGEPEAVLFTVHWNIGKNDFPAGTLVTRDKITSETIVSMLGQLNKQNIRLVQAIIDQMLAMQNKTT